MAANVVRCLGDGSSLAFELGEVDQLEVGGECPDQSGGVFERNAPEFGDQGDLFFGVVTLAELLGAQPDRLLQLVEGQALVLAQCLAKQLSKEADLGAETGLGEDHFGGAGAHLVVLSSRCVVASYRFGR